jgi:hypothetical protein
MYKPLNFNSDFLNQKNNNKVNKISPCCGNRNPISTAKGYFIYIGLYCQNCDKYFKSKCHNVEHYNFKEMDKCNIVEFNKIFNHEII